MRRWVSSLLLAVPALAAPVTDGAAAGAIVAGVAPANETAASERALAAAAARGGAVNRQKVRASAVDFDAFCDTGGNGCWPSSFLLGTQKAGTSAIALALERSGHARMGSLDHSGLPDTETINAHEFAVTDPPRVKDVHAMDEFFKNGQNVPIVHYTRLFRREPGVPTPSFLDATSTYFSDPGAPSVLATVMPHNLFVQAKFVVVLREPISRALNWFNHMRSSRSAVTDPNHVRSDCFKKAQEYEGINDGNVTFDAVASCAMDLKDLFVKWGSYIEGLEAWSSRVDRKQLLVVAHDTLQREPPRAMQMIAQHYSLNTDHVPLPEQYVTEYVSDDVIEVIRCDTLARLRYHFLESNSQLYDRLNNDRHRGYAPDVEEPFPEFAVRVPCADHEITTRERKAWGQSALTLAADEVGGDDAADDDADDDEWLEPPRDAPAAMDSTGVDSDMLTGTRRHRAAKARRGSRTGARRASRRAARTTNLQEQEQAFWDNTTAARLSSDESDDARLQQMGIFNNMKPQQPIIFGVITGGGMEERYGSIAKTWCGPELGACVYFSNDTARASQAAPVPTVDIVQETLDRHSYPNWALRSEYYWPVYRSAQLRFIPALHWLRERVMADPAKNPKTAQYFGAAKWVLLVDDDSFVFYHNLKTHLESLDHNKKIYTGLVSPSYWIPTNLTYNGHGEEHRDGFVNSWDLFVNGGSGSIFSIAAMRDLNTQDCVDEMKPDGRWWQYQSDWAVGSCARRRNIFPTPAERGLFNQFICVDENSRPFFCETYEERQRRHGTEGMIAWERLGHAARGLEDSLDGPLTHPCTIHPIKTVAGYQYLWSRYSSSTFSDTRNVTSMLRALDVAPSLTQTMRVTTVGSPQARDMPMLSMRSLTSVGEDGRINIMK